MSGHNGDLLWRVSQGCPGMAAAGAQCPGVMGRAGWLTIFSSNLSRRAGPARLGSQARSPLNGPC